MKCVMYMLLGTLLGVCKTQYIKPSLCDNYSSTASVERFFDIIFTEFHNAPPACVCIQMCPDQATYCYPNGCLRRPEKKAEHTNCVGNTIRKVLEGTTKSAIFGVNQKDIVDDLEEGPALLTSYGDTIYNQKTNDLILHSNSLKDIVLKYKKVPKLAMKYNLRQQVRNMKLEKLNKEKNIDISKTRWPANKHLLHGKPPIKRMHHYKKNDDSKQTRFFLSVFPESDQTNYSPVFYKKYLTKRDNSNRLNVEALYLYHTDTANFTLETLIDNLIENTLDENKKDAMLTLNIELNDTANEQYSTETSIYNFTDIDFKIDEENMNSLVNNTAAVNIISIDSANVDTEDNKILNDKNMTYQNIPEMIANMSKIIEIQNEATIKLMERAARRKSIISLNESTTNFSDTEGVMTVENATISPITTPTTEKYFSFGNFTVNVYKPVPITTSSVYMKSKQRIIRKLKRRKIK